MVSTFIAEASDGKAASQYAHQHEIGALGRFRSAKKGTSKGEALVVLLIAALAFAGWWWRDVIIFPPRS